MKISSTEKMTKCIKSIISLPAIIMILALYASAIPLFGLGSRERDTAEYRVETYSQDPSVSRPAPSRIVVAGRASLLTANTLYLFKDIPQKVIGLGVTDQGLGDFYEYLDPYLDEKKRLAHTVGPEEIATLNTDLVIVKDTMYSSLGEPLERLGIPVLVLTLETIEQYKEDITTLGVVLDQTERAREINRFYQEELAELERLIGSVHSSDTRDIYDAESSDSASSHTVAGSGNLPVDHEKDTALPRVLLLYFSDRDGEQAFNIPPAAWIQTYQVELAGGSAVWKSSHTSGRWKKVGFEQIAAWDPDVIFITGYSVPGSEFMQIIHSSSQWRQLRAYQNGKVRAVPHDFMSWAQPDTRWILGAQWMAGEMYPQLAEKIDILKKTHTFYTELYNMDDDTVKNSIIPRVKNALEY